MSLSESEIKEISYSVADRIVLLIFPDMDILVGEVMGPGAIPLNGRENRKEPCTGCRIDPNKPFEAGNSMVTTKDAIGTLSAEEVRNWCSELIETKDGRCKRAWGIHEAAKGCKEKYANNTTGFFQCFAPAFGQRIK